MFKDSFGLTELLSEPVNALGFDLWGVEFHSNSKNALLRVFIDKEGGISVDDCALVSHHIEGILDVHDPISHRYTLEVSSPGLDRIFFTFEQMAKYEGNEMSVQLFSPVDGRRRFVGYLKEIGDDSLVFEYNPNPVKSKKAKVVEQLEVITILKDNIDKISLVPQFK